MADFRIVLLRAQHMRKNIYEEALFRSEDDRFELDMVIECGASAIRAMAPLVSQLALLPPDAKANWRLPPVGPQTNPDCVLSATDRALFAPKQPAALRQQYPAACWTPPAVVL